MNGSLVEKCMEGFNKTVYMTKTVDKYICVFKFLIIYFCYPDRLWRVHLSV